MAELVLLGGQSGNYYPDPIVRFYDFLCENPAFWRVAADFWSLTKLDDDPKVWDAEYDRIARLHSLARHARSEEFRQILKAINSLQLNECPRGRALEYIVYRLSPFFTSSSGKTEVQCALYWDEGRGTRVPVASNHATFDVATLSDTDFEAFECKLIVRNFLYYGDRLRSKAASKLEFMLLSHHAAQSTGRRSLIFFIGLDAHPEQLQEKLRQCGHRYVQVLGPRDIARRLSA